jgi:predicted nucleic acid-binding protein
LIQADPDDNKFVDCAVCGNAEFIVSNDSHFRILDDIDWPKLQLVTIQEYIKEIGK